MKGSAMNRIEQENPVENNRITLLAPAKINLSLDVAGRLQNGYHSLDMLMQSVSLFDRVTITLDESSATTKASDRLSPSSDTNLPRITVTCDHPEVPSDEGNIAWKAARLFFAEAALKGVGNPPRPGGNTPSGSVLRQGNNTLPGSISQPGTVQIDIQKRIPAAAGLAGGSTDAAAVLTGLNCLLHQPFDDDELAALALRLGADVPFCLTGGTCRAQGVGEILTPVPGLPTLHVVLAKPLFPLSTASVFGQFRMDAAGERPDTEALLDCIGSGGGEAVLQLARGMRNVLESVSFRLHPELEALVARMDALGALGSRMSGSGPTVFGLFATEEAARNAAQALLRESEPGAADMPEAVDRPGTPDRSATSDRSGTPAKPETVDRPETPGKPETADRPETANRTLTTDTPDPTETSGMAGIKLEVHMAQFHHGGIIHG